MAFEKKWAPLPYTPFTSDGTADGQIQVADAFKLKVKEIVYLKSNTYLGSLKVQVKRVIDPVTFLVGRPGHSIDDRVDVSAFKVADSAQVYNASLQDRPTIGPEEYGRAVYEEEPTVALRAVMVDRGGRFIGSDPTSPFYVQFPDGSINIGTVEAEVTVKLTDKDNTPNPGDVADAVRIGDGTNRWSFLGTGEGKVFDQTTHDKLDVLHADNAAIESDLASFASQNHTDLLAIESKLDTLHADSAQIDSDLNSFAAQSHSDNLAIESKLDVLHTDNGVIETKLDTLHTDNTTTQSDISSFASQNHTDLVAVKTDIDSTNTKLDTLHSDFGVVEGKQDTGNSSLASIDSKLSTTNTEIGSTSETAPATDTATSGLNGRLQRVAQRLTTVDTDLNSFATQNHTDLTAVKSDIDSTNTKLDTLHSDNVTIEGKLDTSNTHLTSIDSKISDDYGASSAAVRVAAQVGNASGQADFGAGSTGAQTLRAASNLYDSSGNGITSASNGVAANRLLHAQTPDTTTSSTALGALNATVSVALAGLSSVGLQLAAGTLVGTLVVECSLDGGVTYPGVGSFYDPANSTTVTSFVFGSNNTAKTVSILPIGGSSHVRVRVSAYTSGTANALLRASMVLAAAGAVTAAAFGTVTNTYVALTASTATLVLAANVNRKYAYISNPTSSTITLQLGSSTGLTGTNRGLVIPANSVFELKGDNLFTGNVYAFTTSGSVTLSVCEGTP